MDLVNGMFPPVVWTDERLRTAGGDVSTDERLRTAGGDVRTDERFCTAGADIWVDELQRIGGNFFWTDKRLRTTGCAVWTDERLQTIGGVVWTDECLRTIGGVGVFPATGGNTLNGFMQFWTFWAVQSSVSDTKKDLGRRSAGSGDFGGVGTLGSGVSNDTKKLVGCRTSAFAVLFINVLSIGGIIWYLDSVSLSFLWDSNNSSDKNMFLTQENNKYKHQFGGFALLYIRKTLNVGP